MNILNIINYCRNFCEMFVNQTMLILAHTAQIMATLSAKAISGVPENNSIQINVTTTTLSPEEEENVFDFDDSK